MTILRWLLHFFIPMNYEDLTGDRAHHIFDALNRARLRDAMRDEKNS